MIFDFLKKRRARIEAKKEALKLLDENTAKIVANLIRIAVIERDKEARFAVWESEIVAWLNEIYSKCENLKYDGKITCSEYNEAVKNAFWNPMIPRYLALRIGIFMKMIRICVIVIGAGIIKELVA